ncbi:MAG: hypothetical protein GY772_08060 [bacterium]|nr:hypothetical protein [bacterium]
MEPKLLFSTACRANTEIGTQVDRIGADLDAESVGQLHAGSFRGSDELVLGGVGFKAQRPDQPNKEVDTSKEPKPHLVVGACG